MLTGFRRGDEMAGAMKKTCFLLISLMLPIGSAMGAMSFVATPIYDATSNANVVDTSATTLDLATFKANVAAAYAAGIGGVVNFDGLPDVATVQYNGVITTTYGAGPATITIGTSAGQVLMNATPGIGATPISGEAYFRLGSGVTTTFTFSAPLSEFGLTLLARNAAKTGISVNGTYSDGTSFSAISGLGILANTATGIPNYIDSPNSSPDTFVGFTAAAGKAISTISINAPNGSNLIMDDLGFILSPIPEPSVCLLGAVGVGGFLIRRRRD